MCHLVIPISLKDILTQFTTGHVSNVDTIIDLRLPESLSLYVVQCFRYLEHLQAA